MFHYSLRSYLEEKNEVFSVHAFSFTGIGEWKFSKHNEGSFIPERQRVLLNSNV